MHFNTKKQNKQTKKQLLDKGLISPLFYMMRLYCLSLLPQMQRLVNKKGKEAVTEEPAQHGPMLFNKILSCLSETTNQNCKSCRWNKEEKTLTSSCNWNQRLTFAHTHRDKDLDITEFEQLNLFRSKGSIVLEDLVLMPFTISDQVPNSSNSNLLYQHFCKYVPFNPKEKH